MAIDAATLIVNVKSAGIDRTQRDLKGLHGGLERADRKAGKFGKGMAVMGKAAKFGGLALGVGLVGGVKKSLDAFAESERVAKQTAAVLKSTGGAANVTAKDVDRLAQSISRKTGIDDEAVQSSENLLLTFTKVRNEAGRGNDVFNRATRVVQDMSVALGQDAKSSAIQVGKALNDPIKGVTALQRVGVSFTAKQKEQIKTLVESGRTLDAQKLILRELNTEFGGSAEAAGNTFQGSINKAKVAVENLFESVGARLAPALATAATATANFINQINTGTGAGGRFAASVSNAWAQVVGVVGPAVRSISGWVRQNQETFRDLGNGVQTIFRGVLVPAFQFAFAAAQRVFPAIQQIFSGFATWVRGIVNVIAGILTLDFGRAFQGLKQMTSGALNYLIGLWRAATAPFREAAARIGRGILSALSGAWASVKGVTRSAVGAVVGIVRGAVSPAASAAVSVGRGIVRGVGRAAQIVGDVAGFFGRMRSAIIRQFNNAFNAAYKIGQAIVSGIVSAIASLPSKVAGIGLSAGRSLLGGLKSAGGKLAGLAGFAKGGVLSGPQLVVAGEEGRSHPEFFISTNPRDRQRSLKLLMRAAQHLGLPGMASGGEIPGHPGRTADLLTGGKSGHGSRWWARGIARNEGLQLVSGFRHPGTPGIPDVEGSSHWVARGGNAGAYDLGWPKKKQGAPGSPQRRKYMAALKRAAARAQRNGIVTAIHSVPALGTHLHLDFLAGQDTRMDYEGRRADSDIALANAPESAEGPPSAARRGAIEKRGGIIAGRMSAIDSRRAAISRLLKRRLTPGRRRALRKEYASLGTEKASLIGEAQTLHEEYNRQAPAPEVDTAAAGGAGGAAGESSEVESQLAELVASMVANQNRIIELTQRQGPQMLAAVVAAVNGGIGGKAGISRRTPSYAGLGGLGSL